MRVRQLATNPHDHNRARVLQIAVRSSLEWCGWFILATGILLVSLGSAYYHWRPNNRTLVWDRLPMTIAFMALFALMVEERVGQPIARYLATAAQNTKYLDQGKAPRYA